MKKTFMKGIASAAALSLVLSMTACGSKADETTAGTEAASETTEGVAAEEGTASEKDTLIIATANETPSVTTYLHSTVAGNYINTMTHNGLFKTNENMEIVPDLCESYEILSDTEWQFKIKEGVKFHNGETVTAEDVKATLELAARSPEVAQHVSEIKEIEVLDEFTVKVTTDGAYSGLLTDLTNYGTYVLPKVLIESGHDFNKEPIGTGPYKFVSWTKGESITLEAFEDYFGEPAKIKNVIWKIIPEGSSRTMALEAGEVDLITEVETTDVSRLQDESGIAVFNGSGTSHNFMMINNEIAPFNNADFRRALNAAIDRDAVVQVALNGAGSPIDSQVPNCFPGATSEGAPTYDPEAAQAYLEASGLDPAECGFSLICSDDTKLRAGQVIQSCLKENLGIDVELQSMDLATYIDLTTEGNYDAALGGYTTTDMLTYVQGIFHSSCINASNSSRVNTPEIDALIEKLKATLDPTEREKVVEELSIAVNKLCPQVPLYMKNNTRAYNESLTGFNCNAGGTTRYEQMSWN